MDPSIVTTLSNVIGFDDGPFDRRRDDRTALVGAVCARTRLDGVVRGEITIDGHDATDAMVELLERSQFRKHLQAVLVQGIAFGGFNVVDLKRLVATLGLPAMAVVRKRPNYTSVRRVLAEKVPDGAAKIRLLDGAGEVEPLRGLFVQRVGMSRSEAGELLRHTTLHGALPEPLRLAHLIAGAVVEGVSRGGA